MMFSFVQLTSLRFSLLEGEDVKITNNVPGTFPGHSSLGHVLRREILAALGRKPNSKGDTDHDGSAERYLTGSIK